MWNPYSYHELKRSMNQSVISNQLLSCEKKWPVVGISVCKTFEPVCGSCWQNDLALSEIIQKHTFVGIADFQRCLSLVQHETKLYLVNHAALSEEFFYQLGLRQFGNFHKIKLEPPPPLRELIKLAIGADEQFLKAGLDLESGITVSGSFAKLFI